MNGQFTEDYISSGLKELVGYYSNRLSYEEVSLLLGRLSGQPQLSDQKAEQLVLEKGQEISEQIREELAQFEREAVPMPPIQAAVDVYDRQSEEVLLLADGIQVKEQAAKRQKRSERRAEEKHSRSFAPTHLVMLAKATGGYEYISELLPGESQSDGFLAQQVRRQIISQYGQRETPLNLVAITDGATTLRLLLQAIFGLTVTIILDWYHLEKKVNELMSMIAHNKEEKEKHLQTLLALLWRGLTNQALAYLQTLTPKNAAQLLVLQTYLQKHQTEIIDYQRRQQAGKVIGSGRMEKGCDLVIGHRQKKKGMSWSLMGSRSLALLKVAELNKQWSQLWFSQPIMP